MIEQRRLEVSPATSHEVSIFAADRIKTSVDIFSNQGFGRTTSLEKPISSTTYHWSGILHGKGTDNVGSSNCRDTLSQLAANFAENYRGHQNPDLQKAGKASYTLCFEPTSMDTLTFSSGQQGQVTIRPLTAEEQQVFMRAFQQANKMAIA